MGKNKLVKKNASKKISAPAIEELMPKEQEITIVPIVEPTPIEVVDAKDKEIGDLTSQVVNFQDKIVKISAELKDAKGQAAEYAGLLEQKLATAEESLKKTTAQLLETEQKLQAALSDKSKIEASKRLLQGTNTRLESEAAKLKDAVEMNYEKYTKEVKYGNDLANTILKKKRGIKHRNIAIAVLAVLLALVLIF